ncbi:MAG: hypothetical protein A2Z11_04330 [Candidatus Woykebacteria bacterium RBG_16_43_9]|uniref:DegT/DnrJ/EryC1/StrS aminotransferase n=1 Tax=Candidatus Woykebacteria bacterium RBG_16_43_9 TaxID=1802596 RepID=A0A1G1WG81_9BACT|nr:MAG: hypothetical protein A2Z11_04330 [Candidatus Woykebacteria bacterium RBG_16_43_9]
MAKSRIVKTIFRNIFRPHADSALEPVEQLKEALEKYFALRVFPVNSGRSGLYLILKSAGIGKGDEVIIQAYTCNAVPNPIIWTGAKPVYADINPETLNVDPNEVEKKITDKTKAIILQHTFGRPGSIQELSDLARKHDLLLIEDCAHALGAKYNGKKLGTFGDAAILSFGREKVISSLTGGAILMRNSNLIKPILNNVSQLPPMTIKRTSQEFLNFFAWRLLLRRIYFNETGHKFIRRLNNYDFFNVVTAEKEKVGERPAWYPAAMPSVLASVALEEFEQLDKYNKARGEIAQYYYENIQNSDFRLLPSHEGIYLRVVALHKKALQVLAEARKRKYWFGNWYNAPIYPNGVNEEKLGYIRGTCPNAELAAEQTINLPNYLGMGLEEVKEVVEFVNNFE